MRGSELRARREAQGLTLAEVSEATGIAVEHLRALEDDRHDDLPPGPYAAAYERTLSRHLGLPSEAPASTLAAGPARPGAPLWLVRLLAFASVAALLALLVWSARERVNAFFGARPGGSRSVNQRLVVVARATTRLVVRADGAAVLDRTVAGGEELTFEARDSLEIEVPGVSNVSLQWNGDLLVPQGRQDAPRLIVLVDDEDGG